MSTSTIAYTKTDEAPALATYSLLPILRAFTASSGINYELKDISLAGRILAHFPDSLKPEQRIADALAELGKLATEPDANIIKLPNISAIIPNYRMPLKSFRQRILQFLTFHPIRKPMREEIRATYAKVLGSAVNPVLREGNSDRRVAKLVKEYAQKNHIPWVPGQPIQNLMLLTWKQGIFTAANSQLLLKVKGRSPSNLSIHPEAKNFFKGKT